jgi:hypothetical protein
VLGSINAPVKIDLLVARAVQFKSNIGYIAAMADEEVKQENKHLTLMVENQMQEQVQFKVRIQQGAAYLNSRRCDGAKFVQARAEDWVMQLITRRSYDSSSCSSVGRQETSVPAAVAEPRHAVHNTCR